MGWLSPGPPLTGHIGESYSGVRVSFAQFEYPSRSLRQVQSQYREALSIRQH
jgi:hypothetical protein